MTNTHMPEPVGRIVIDRIGKTAFIGSTRASERLGEGSYVLITTSQGRLMPRIECHCRSCRHAIRN